MKFFIIVILCVLAANAKGQTKIDTIKCYVQIMVPASGTIGLSKEIEDNQIFVNGGIILYTKAYAILEDNMYIKFLTPKRKELKNIWKPKNPEVMEFEW